MSRRIPMYALIGCLLLQSLGLVGCEAGRPSEPLPPGDRVGWYVRTTGTNQGNGTDTLSWSLAYALAGAGGRIRPGDTVWVRGGTYSGAFSTSLTGTSTAPIVVRAYPGERAILDGAPSNNATFIVNGAWAIYWGLEVMNSKLDRYGEGFDIRPTGVYPYSAANVKLINFVVHDVGQGIYTEPAASNIEVYGWIIYNGGHQLSYRSAGHAIYTKNDGPGQKIFRDNVMFNNLGFGVHAYANAGSGLLKNLVFEGNVAFNNGSLSDYVNQNFQVGGGTVADQVTVIGNMTYVSPGLNQGSVRLGYQTLLNGAMTFRDNYVVGGVVPIEFGYWQDLAVLGNTLVSSGAMVRLNDPNTAGQLWSGNAHYRDPAATAWRYNGTNYTFAGWQAATGLGATDNAASGTPSAPYVMVRPHQYLPGAALVAIVNWPEQATVPVSLAGIGLSNGNRFEVRNVQALWGAPVLTATYSGGTVNFPMAGVNPPAPIGGSPNPPTRTGPKFDVFVVRRVTP